MEGKVTTNAWAAAYVGLEPSTWRGYVSRGQAPRPDGYEVESHRVVAYWNRATLDEWIAKRKGTPGRPRRRSAAA